MKTFAISLVSGICVLAALASPRTSEAQAPLIFQTTFDCPDWDQSMGLSDAAVCRNGDGIRGNGGWTTKNGSRDQITPAANNPSGGGGKGFRHWVGDGLNNTGGGIVVSFSPVSEMWFRYYIRFQSGFTWGRGINMKTIYCNRGQPGTFFFGIFRSIGAHVAVDRTGGNGNHLSNVNWSQWQDGWAGDGKWHVLEVHAKMNTTGESSDGVLEFWLNGRQIYSRSTVHFAKTTGAMFTNCAVGENHHEPQNGGVDVHVDFDDIAVSAAGYIGPIKQ